MKEFAVPLGFYEMVYHEEDKIWYSETKEGIFEREYTFREGRHIPYWQEIILSWSSGWSSFGLEYPRASNSLIAPIVNTYSPEDDQGQQKTFNSF
ncbi:hypothetical protein D3H65_00055 [Paraflavitalea soli]|uniref:Uncharacterized protein n=1 Tax=Paraflavitalea soli TaxID=2315862 RepID=A0A3B7MDT1_9BACT|nr:hypothetical protein D3H65_00055 [Paraflavitalea soli]